jgi:hypothetical protein
MKIWLAMGAFLLVLLIAGCNAVQGPAGPPGPQGQAGDNRSDRPRPEVVIKVPVHDDRDHSSEPDQR